MPLGAILSGGIAAFKGGMALGRAIRGGGNQGAQASGGSRGGDPLTAKASSPLIRNLLEGQNKVQEFGIKEAQKSMKGSRAALNPATGFFKRLLSGDQSSIAQAIGPHAGTVIGQFESARRAASENAPRGGGRNQLLAQAPFQKAGAVSDLVQETIPVAAEGLLRAGEIEGGIGTRLMSIASDAGSRSLQTLVSGRNVSLAEQERKDRNLRGLAVGLADIISVMRGSEKTGMAKLLG